jgi:hypothetical protein
MAAVAGLAAGLACGGSPAVIAAQQCDADSYFARHPGPVVGQTGSDLCYPSAPVDVSVSGAASGEAGNARVGAEQTASSEGTAGEWSSSPRLPHQPY